MSITKLLQIQDFCCAVCYDTLTNYEMDDSIAFTYKQVRIWDKVTKRFSKPVALVCSKCHDKLQSIDFDLSISKAITNLLSKEAEYENDIISN